MSDLISRQAAIEAFYIQSDDDGWWVGTAQDAETLLNGLPTSERVGKWVYKEIDDETGIEDHEFCSECGFPRAQIYGNFCAVCGARMRGEEG